jgi:hypothetical protein
MIPANSIVSVRRAPIARFFAVWLILLTVAPFTAPFSTCDAAELTSEIAACDKRPCAKFTDEAVDAGVAVSLASPIAVFVSLVRCTMAAEPRERSSLLIVLRI